MLEPDVLLSLLQGLGIMALAAIGYGTIERQHLPKIARSLLQGLLFGCAAVLSIMSAVQFDNGVLLDPRGIIIALGSAFAGAPGALVAGAVAGGYRMALGGPVSTAGALGIVYCAAMGLVWLRWFKRQERATVGEFAGLGLFAVGQVAFLLFTPAASLPTLAELLAYHAVSSVAAAVAFGKLMCRERSFIARERRLSSDARTDALTGLHNRRSLDTVLSRRLARSHAGGPGFSFLAIDIDHFKQVNDTFGHATGDRALIHLADLLQMATRQDDVVARLGGEEFGVVLASGSLAEAQAAAERIRAAVEAAPLSADAGPLAITVSIGVAAAPLHAGSAAALLQAADQALYAAKRAGRNRVECAAAAAAAAPSVPHRSAEKRRTVLPAR